MRLQTAVSRVIVAVVITAGSTCSAHGLAQLLAGFRPMLLQGTPGFRQRRLLLSIWGRLP